MFFNYIPNLRWNSTLIAEFPTIEMLKETRVFHWFSVSKLSVKWSCAVATINPSTIVNLFEERRFYRLMWLGGAKGEERTLIQISMENKFDFLSSLSAYWWLIIQKWTICERHISPDSRPQTKNATWLSGTSFCALYIWINYLRYLGSPHLRNTITNSLEWMVFVSVSLEIVHLNANYASTSSDFFF